MVRKIVLFGLFINLIFVASFGQNIITSRQSSFYTYIFKITNKEAAKIYRNDLYKVDYSFLHTIVDSIPTDSTYNKPLPTGHYLKVFALGNKMSCGLMSIQPYTFHLFNNSTDLVIQLREKNNQIIKDAQVHAGLKKLNFDTIYHEHMYYYSVIALNNLFRKKNMYIEDFEEIPTHSGSIRLYVKKGNNVLI